MTIALTELRTDGATCEGAVAIAADLPFFDGHFDGQPVLPAVAQLAAIVAPAARRAWPDLGRLERLARLKFQRLVAPGAHLAVRLERSGGAVRFTLREADAPVSSGTLHFASAP